ncbi:hypothetical protein [uncultured Ruminococcus sp.]|nr:hypothetical protein [uncultured Ruminococcus sp.]
MADLPLKSGKLVVVAAWLFLYAVAFSGSRRCVQAAKGKPFGYQKFAIT